MVDRDEDRYWSMTANTGNPSLAFMVWDFTENENIGYYSSEAHADRVARLLNQEVIDLGNL